MPTDGGSTYQNDGGYISSSPSLWWDPAADLNGWLYVYCAPPDCGDMWVEFETGTID